MCFVFFSDGTGNTSSSVSPSGIRKSKYKVFSLNHWLPNNSTKIKPNNRTYRFRPSFQIPSIQCPGVKIYGNRNPSKMHSD